MAPPLLVTPKGCDESTQQQSCASSRTTEVQGMSEASGGNDVTFEGKRSRLLNILSLCDFEVATTAESLAKPRVSADGASSAATTTSPRQGQRDQFLNLLARGLRDAEAAAPPPPVRAATPRAKCENELASTPRQDVPRAAVSREQILSELTQAFRSIEETTPEVNRPKSGDKSLADQSPRRDPDGVFANAAQCSSRRERLPRMMQSSVAKAEYQFGQECKTAVGFPIIGGPGTPRAGQIGRSNSCQRQRTELASSDSACSDVPVGPTLRSEQRRPRRNETEVLAPPPPNDEELLQEKSDELLRWAEEVLQKAQQQSAKTELPATPIKPPPRPRPHISTASSPSASARERRAEELRNVVRNLQNEAENECDRLEIGEAANRRNLQRQQEEPWRDRINLAADGMRRNVARGCAFESPRFDAGSGGHDTPQRRGNHGGGAATRGSSSVPPLPSTSARAVLRSTAQVDSEAMWARLENRLEASSDVIHLHEIPWPSASASITGILASDASGVAKQKLAVALRRWHPDKWRRILDRVPECEQSQLMERVKGIAQQLLEEKARLKSMGKIGK